MTDAALRHSVAPRPPESRAPAVVGCGVVLVVAALGLVGARFMPVVAPPRLPAPPAGAVALAPSVLQVVVRPGERLPEALHRAGVAFGEARVASALLGRAFDVAHLRAGLLLRAVVTRPHGAAGPPRLEHVTLATGPASAATVRRAPDGGFTLARTSTPLHDETTVAAGVIEGSLYESAVTAGATPALVSQAVKLFSKSLDFARDIHGGDAFRLVFDRRADGRGRTVEAGDLLYAEVVVDGRARRFYRFEHDGEVDYVDEVGTQQKALLLKTPLDGAHVTSSFGMRLHPLLGYTRMHPGIDFGAPIGTPVFAAGDGVVEEARWAGGYGHWLKLGHASGWETGYGHLSGYAAGVRPGVRVTQGQVVAYVGSTGLSTGPHLHYEIMRGGVKMNPLTAEVPMGSTLSRTDVAAFAAEKRRIDGLLAPHSVQVAALALRPRGGG